MSGWSEWWTDPLCLGEVGLVGNSKGPRQEPGEDTPPRRKPKDASVELSGEDLCEGE